MGSSYRSLCTNCQKQRDQRKQKKDWVCEQCHEMQFKWRKKCRNCGPLTEQRLAFMAAWHPRAGNPLMQRLIAKDIGIMIARDYL